jgi:hypothetical protein
MAMLGPLQARFSWARLFVDGVGNDEGDQCVTGVMVEAVEAVGAAVVANGLGELLNHD